MKTAATWCCLPKLSPEETAAAFPNVTQPIEIEAFLDADEIPFVSVERPYFTVKGFSHGVVQHMARTISQRFVAKSSPKNRVARSLPATCATASAWACQCRGVGRAGGS